MTGAPAAGHRSTARRSPQWEPVDGPGGRACWRSARPADRACARTCWSRAAWTSRTSSAARPPSPRPVRRPRRPGAAHRATSLRGRRRRRRGRTAGPARGPARASPAPGRSAPLEGPHAAPEFFTRGRHRRLLRRRLEGPLQLGPHRRPAGRPQARAGRAPTAARRACTRPTSTTPRTRSAPSTTPATCRSCSAPTARRSAASSARRRSSPAERWKLGQLRPGDTVRFVPVDEAEADALRTRPQAPRGRRGRRTTTAASSPRKDGDTEVTYRRSGDDNLLVEYGADAARPGAADARARARTEAARATTTACAASSTSPRASARSRCTSTPTGCRCARLLDLVREIEDALPATDGPRRAQPHRPPAAVLGRPGDPRGDRALHGRRPRRRPLVPVEHRVHPPRSTAWTPSTTSTARSSTRSTWSWAWATSTWAPRSPPRSTRATAWSPPSTTRPAPGPPENSVGIGGAYLCIYGMEGPGGYQFVGRTTQVWSTRHASAAPFEPGTPVAAAVLRPHPLVPGRRGRTAGPARRHGRRAASTSRIEQGTFSLAEHQRFLAENADVDRGVPRAAGGGVRRRAGRVGGGGRVRPRDRARRTRRRRPTPRSPTGARASRRRSSRPSCGSTSAPATWSSAASSCSPWRR